MVNYNSVRRPPKLKTGSLYVLGIKKVDCCEILLIIEIQTSDSF